MNKGYVLVIEGTDGSGKQTQTNLMYRSLEEKYPGRVHKFSFPNYESPSAAPIKMYLDGELGGSDVDVDAYQASIIYATDRLCTYLKEIKQYYEKGDIIIMDRYTTSNALHQACKIRNTLERDKFLDWMFDMEYNVLHLPKPDKVIFLNVPVETSLKLREAREKQQGFKSGSHKDIHEQNPDHMKNAYEAGMYVSLKYGWNVVACTDKNGNMQSIEDIHNKISKKVVSDINRFFVASIR